MVYFLVLLQELSPAADEVDHEPFIDSLDRRNLVLPGGPFDEPPIPDVTVAHVLRCQGWPKPTRSSGQAVAVPPRSAHRRPRSSSRSHRHRPSWITGKRKTASRPTMGSMERHWAPSG
jgi:hypothetical protein